MSCCSCHNKSIQLLSLSTLTWTSWHCKGRWESHLSVCWSYSASEKSTFSDGWNFQLVIFTYSVIISWSCLNPQRKNILKKLLQNWDRGFVFNYSKYLENVFTDLFLIFLKNLWHIRNKIIFTIFVIIKCKAPNARKRHKVSYISME